jgi:predicted nuclease of predicted toxin-antitoxin system
MKILIDVNLSPRWIEVFEQNNLDAVHWTAVGDPKAPDQAIMEWARQHNYVVFTHDLDFGTLLAITYAVGPSVIQVRTQDVLPDHLKDVVLAAIRQYEAILDQGALIVVDETSSRARILPITK